MKLKKAEDIRASDLQYGGDHYKQMGIQPWDLVDTWPFEARMAVYRHGALKYLMRMGSKDDMRLELEKARHYIDKMLEVVCE
jgi:hypothetical protein